VISFGRSRARSLILVAACVACSSGGGKSDAGATGGSGGSNAGSGGVPAAGSGGAGGVGGTAGGGGTTGAAGSGGTTGTAGSGGTTGNAGRGGTGAGGTPAGTCTFDVQHMASPAIGTVEIVTWALDESGLTEARIEFGPAGAAPTWTAPVDLADPLHRTLLLGLKGQKPYTFRIVARAGTKTCTSADVSFTTGAVPSNAPKITTTKPKPGMAAKGFMVTTIGVDNTNRSGGQPDAYIFDTDGDVVWWTSTALDRSRNGISRAHLSWDAKSLWVMTSTNAKILHISMDGLTTTDYTAFITKAHHDFTVLPDGGIATMLDPLTTGGLESIVEMKADGTITTVVADLTTLYQPGGTGPYPNAIHYYPADDSYTVSDHEANLFVKFRRSGQLVWQLGGTNPLGKSFALVGLDQWRVNHGHHLTPDGRFLFFNNNPNNNGYIARIFEVLLDETNNTATKTWEYSFSSTAIALGDAERLPNGNALVTNSVQGVMQEVDRTGTIVQTFTNTTFGYVDFRTSLYGPPPR